MKVGDLVNFETKAWVFADANERYKNPGIVLQVIQEPRSNSIIAEVLWADGRLTREHDGYLHSAADPDELSDEQLEHVRGGMGNRTFSEWRAATLNEAP